MKFWAILQIIVDGFWGGSCGVCVGAGGGFSFYSFGGPRVQEVNLFFPTYANVFQHFFDFCYTGNSRGQQEVEFPGVFTKNSCGISTGLGF